MEAAVVAGGNVGKEENGTVVAVVAFHTQPAIVDKRHKRGQLEEEAIAQGEVEAPVDGRHWRDKRVT